MKKAVKIIAVILVVAVILCGATFFAAEKSSVKVKIDAASLGDEVGNKVSNINVWDMGTQFYDPKKEENNDVFEFVRYIQLMQCTGGTYERDLFKNPEDTSVLDDYDFSRLVKNCRGILILGAKPHLKLGSVPVKFTSGCENGGFDMNVFPPDDYEVYYNYIKAMAEKLVEEFGTDELLTWRFGCMTEYENADWFKSKDGDPQKSAESYCKLYDYTAAALCDVLGDGVYIGAHSMTVTEGLWDEEIFIKHVATEKNYKTGKVGTPIKFLSASFYDTKPGKFTKGKTLSETVDYLRNTAEKYGLRDLTYGIDEGRILYGNAKGKEDDALFNRTCGDTWQAAYDARLYKTCIDKDIEYFSSWGYLTGGALSGYPIISYFVAQNTALFDGCKKVSSKTSSLKNIVGAEADCVALYDEESETLRVMLYNFKNDVGYDKSVDFKLSINIPQFDGEEVKIIKKTVNDDCNFFDEWRDDRKKYNITDDKFNWSPDDPCIDSTVTLFDEEARSTYEAELRYRYIQCAKLTPEKLDGVVRDSLLKLNFTVGASNVVFLEISKR